MLIARHPVFVEILEREREEARSLVHAEREKGRAHSLARFNFEKAGPLMPLLAHPKYHCDF